MISKDAIKRIEEIIDKYGKAIIIRYAGPESVPPEELTMLIAEGILKPEDVEGSLAMDSYLVGKLRGVIEAAKREEITPSEFRSRYRATASTLNPSERKTVDMLQDSVAHAMDGFRNEIKQKVKGALLNVTFENMREYLGEPVKNILEQSYLENKSLGRLIQDLRKHMGDFSSKWKTIATTETTKAINAGISDEIVATNKGVPPEDLYVFFQVVRDSKLCPHCKRVHLTPTGLPKVYKLSEVIANGSNYGKKASEWKASLSGLHPNCRCSISQLPIGWGFESGSSYPQYIAPGHKEYDKKK